KSGGSWKAAVLEIRILAADGPCREIPRRANSSGIAVAGGVSACWRRGSDCLAHKEQSGFERLPAPESLFSCVAKRKVTQREGHPDGAPSGPPALRVRGRVPGFSDGTSLYRRKTGPHPCGPSCGLSFTHPPRHRGPG